MQLVHNYYYGNKETSVLTWTLLDIVIFWLKVEIKHLAFVAVVFALLHVVIKDRYGTVAVIEAIIFAVIKSQWGPRVNHRRSVLSTENILHRTRF